MAAGMTRREAIPAIAALFALPIIGCGDGTQDGGIDGGVGPDTGPTPDVFIPPTDFSVEAGVANLSCTFLADIDTYADGILGSCPQDGAGESSEVFSLNPQATERPIPVDVLRSFGDLGTRTISHLTVLPDGMAVVVSDDWGGGESGLYHFPLDGSEEPTFIPFPPGHTFAGGPIVAQNKLFIPTANFEDSFYNPGTVLVYGIHPNGTLGTLNVRFLTTTALNPTGTAKLDDDHILVLNSGDFGANPSASLDIINIWTEVVERSIPLGNLTAQVGGELTVTADGRVIIGTAAFDSSAPHAGQVLVVDIENSEITTLQTEGAFFHSSIKADENLFYVTDFNTGQVFVFNLHDLAFLQSVQVTTEGSAGPSELTASGLLQAIPNGLVLVSPS